MNAVYVAGVFQRGRYENLVYVQVCVGDPERHNAYRTSFTVNDYQDASDKALGYAVRFADPEDTELFYTLPYAPKVDTSFRANLKIQSIPKDDNPAFGRLMQVMSMLKAQ